MSEQSQKVPSQIFKWFERMKGNYEQSVQNVLKQFEAYSATQQKRIDNTHEQHINQLQLSNEQITKQYEQQISQLNKDVAYYRQQLDSQQKTIEELNTRYDTVIRCMLPNKQTFNMKDIFSEHDFVAPVTDSLENTETTNKNSFNSSDNETIQNNASQLIQEDKQELYSQEELFEQALLKRENGESDAAFLLFEQSAKRGHIKSMGAMGRSFFLGEGTEENPSLGLAWLIKAADNELPQAVVRVKHFAENDPDLYEEALIRSEEIAL